MDRDLLDKQFMIGFDRDNRDFFISAKLYVSLFIVFISIIIVSVIAMLFMLRNASSFNISFAVLLCAVWCPVIFICCRIISRCSRGAKECESQLKENLLKLYPEYNNKTW